MTHIEAARTTKASIVFLFAHQDDEMGVFFEIEDVLRRGLRPVCMYFTDGIQPGVETATRCAESLAVLNRLGVDHQDVHFIGRDFGIPDGFLHEHLRRALGHAQDVLAGLPSVEAFIMHSYEGGHQDHDAVYAIGVLLAEAHQISDSSRQFTLYRASSFGFWPYVVFQPLPENGPVTTRRIPLADRLRYLWLLSAYASQRKAVAGLFPFICLDYAISGTQKLQGIDASRLRHPPHAGAPLYEKRGRANYNRVRHRIDELLAGTHSNER